MLRNYSNVAAALRVRRQNRSQGAFDLTELALYLVAGILLLIGIIALFESVFGSTKTTTAESQFNTITTEVRSLYGSASTYTGLTTSVVANSGALPTSWLDASPPAAANIYNPFKGAVTVTADATATNFDIKEDSLPVQACTALATQDEGSSFVSESINGKTVTTVPTAATAQGDCNAAGNAANTITWILN
jgi:hypothetical protein